MSSESMIQARGLAKSYGETHALAGIDLDVPAGTILGVLGPNGAGKTTAVRILTTLAHPSAGTARVAGFDVVTDAAQVRRNIGVAAQDATVDEALTGRQNLDMIGELTGLRRTAARARTTELLERFGLTDAGSRIAKTYSGGMRRRLDLAASVVARPTVLFLDEPTTGLDPISRVRMWDVIRQLVTDGTTLLLTTQYLDEADTLADNIVVIDHGRVIAEGTSRELKESTGGARLSVTLTAPSPLAVAALQHLVEGTVHVSDDGRRLHAAVRNGSGLGTEAVRALDQAGVMVDDVAVLQPSLDDVFFELTGRPTEVDADEVDADTGAEEAFA